MELTGLSDSFAALARYYERHYRPDDTWLETAPKLFITRLETGSIIAEIAPYAVFFGQVIAAINAPVIVANFTHRLVHAVRAFTDPGGSLSRSASEQPSRDDAADLRAFLRPLTGRPGAALGVRHARFRKRDGKRETVAEYVFDEAEINRAAANIEKVLSSGGPAIPASETKGQRFYPEVMLFFQQASRSPAKEAGRTGDRAIVPDISDKPLLVYFRKGINDLKERMVRGDANPLNKAFIVDVHVQEVNGEPKAYLVTDLHDVMDLDPDDKVL
jgi:hypothetical protein